MKRYLLDSGILSAFINKREGVDVRARTARLTGARIGTAMPVVGEMLFGIELSVTREENLHRFKRALAGLYLWPLDSKAVQEYGHVAATLRRIGRPMQQLDMQMAAIALSLGNCTVVTKDSDLLAVPGLVVENWAITG